MEGFTTIKIELPLRDYFAAAALTGLLMNPANNNVTTTEFVESCYKLADAMLAERAK